MKKNNAQKEKIHTTMDAYTAGWLTLKGFTPRLIEQGYKIVFCFDATPELFQSINEYNSGASVEAIRFSLTIKTLKSQIHSLRKSNGNGIRAYQQA